MSKILILTGGSSSERVVSLRSGRAVANALSANHTVTVADVSDPGFDLQKLCSENDMAFPIIHGVGGEDGTLQLKLEEFGIPFLGSGHEACHNSFFKDIFKDIVKKNNVRIPKGEIVDKYQFISSSLAQKPFVLKPIDGGSSIDTVINRNMRFDINNDYVESIFVRHKTMLLEELVEGRELTVGVFGNKPMPIIHIVTPTDSEFDYENKYNGKTKEIVDPLDIDSELKEAAKELALKVHNILGCRHLSRTDMILTDSGDLVVLEINVMPGMTSQSLYPKMADIMGYDMGALMSEFARMVSGS